MNATKPTAFQAALRWAKLESDLQSAMSAVDSARVRGSSRDLGKALQRAKEARMAIFWEGQDRG